MHPKIVEHREVWARKPGLRAIYADYYRRILAACRPGRTLEIGGGSGNLKAYLPQAICTDIVWSPWLDLAADAQCLPFRDACADSIVAVDVLHHLGAPAEFFAEAARVLVPGGRLVLLEPAITPGSYGFYKLFHPELVRLRVDPLAPVTRRDPFDANQAIPSLLFGRHRAEFARRFPQFAIVERRHLSLFAYPLSGGFRSWSALPGSGAALLALERWLERWLGPVLGFRLLVVLERRG